MAGRVNVLGRHLAAGKHEQLMGFDGDNRLGVNDLFNTVAGKVVLVTGGSIGIGRYIAEGFVRNGATVYICSRKRPACDITAAELTALGPGKAISMPGDMSTEAGVLAVADAIKAAEPKLHVLVNNAGSTWGAPFDEYPDKAWSRIFDLNLRGVFNLTKYLAPALEAAAVDGDPARVINISSVAGSIPTGADNRVSAYAYAPSKAALNHLTLGLVRVLGDRGITVNAIAPGLFPTKMNAHIVGNDAAMDMAAGACALGRVGVPGDMAGTALFLASRAGSFVTGAIIPVSGGIVGLG